MFTYPGVRGLGLSSEQTENKGRLFFTRWPEIEIIFKHVDSVQFTFVMCFFYQCIELSIVFE